MNNGLSQCTKQVKKKQIRYLTKTATNYCQNFHIFMAKEGWSGTAFSEYNKR